MHLIRENKEFYRENPYNIVADSLSVKPIVYFSSSLPGPQKEYLYVRKTYAIFPRALTSLYVLGLS